MNRIYRFWGADAFGRQDEQGGVSRMGREDRMDKIMEIYRLEGTAWRGIDKIYRMGGKRHFLVEILHINFIAEET
ncbi:MAG: hypothetical protein H6559_32920 [Lewinellaceae bacterium]|nr:hypothetical protein [Lewinellaceae bacterium]